MPAWNAPWHGPAAATQPINPCNDRPHTNYIGECTRRAAVGTNHYPDLRPYWRQNLCQLALPLHPPGHTVCGQCHDSVDHQHWNKLALARIQKRPQRNSFMGAGGDREEKAWRGFRTRMCGICEMREQYLIRARLLAIAGVGTATTRVPPMALRQRMENYPRNTCTCLWELEQGQRLCIRHRKSLWDTFSQAAGQRVDVRNQNREWLRTSATNPLNGVLCTARNARLQNRDMCAPGFQLRACRCGDEVTAGVPEVYQCMGCEGIIQVTPLAVAPPLIPPINPALLDNSANQPVNPFRLRRPRHALKV